MSLELYCPYPDCETRFSAAAGVGSGSCGCRYSNPVRGCVRCGMSNRGEAGYCRRCGAGLESASLRTGNLVASEVDFLAVKGRFRRPPLMINGMLFALATDGVLHRISPCKGAQAKVVGEIGARGAGFNRSASARIAGEGGTLQGWTYVAASRSGIAAVSLATGATQILEEARPGEEISANSSEAEATGFRGVVANDEFCGFAVTTAENDFVLTIKGFSRERPPLRPLAVHGKRLAGPALHDGLVVMCTEEEAGIYDVATRTELKMALPAGFAALLRPSSVDLSVAPGSIPLVGTRGRDGGLKATIAGSQGGVAGALEVDFRRKTSEFQRRPAGSSFYSNADGSLSVSALDRVERIGHERSVDKVRSLEPGMPACVEGDMRLWFAEQQYKGNHRVMMSRGTQTTEVAFNDAACTKDTCCGIYFAGVDVVIAYLSDGSEGAGMRLARWSFE